ncbi:IS3 family transposase [Nibrella viscosa]|uniref:IS3 family transposase n=1 Tax=Nibrella viscosa TaxID=1084524 RepID=A0ABP8L4C0_9BACT
MASTFTQQGTPVRFVLAQLGLAPSVFYYRPTVGKKGCSPLGYTLFAPAGVFVTDEEVVALIKALFHQEFVDYGYIKTTHWLRQQGYAINRKKVYRLLKEHRLLLSRLYRDRAGKHFVQYRVPKPVKPFEHLETDLKYIYVAGQGRNALLISIVDVLSRAIVGFKFQFSITKHDVVGLIKQVLQQYCFPLKVTLRNDNGSQFEAKLVREYLQQMHIDQEFSHVATPQDNGHIESYHSIVEHVICRRYEFASLAEADQTIERFVDFYNHERLHSGLGYQCPASFLSKQGIRLPRLKIKSVIIESVSNL